MNYSQPEEFEPRETDRQGEEPTHYAKMWNSSMLWEVGLILLVALVLFFCAWYFSAQGRDVAEIAGTNKDMTWEAIVEVVKPSGKIVVDSVPTANSPFDILLVPPNNQLSASNSVGKDPRHSPKSRSR
jgi:heme/copper-type cytochrome/quinol oxidase subunit 2